MVPTSRAQRQKTTAGVMVVVLDGAAGASDRGDLRAADLIEQRPARPWRSPWPARPSCGRRPENGNDLLVAFLPRAFLAFAALITLSLAADAGGGIRCSHVAIGARHPGSRTGPCPTCPSAITASWEDWPLLIPSCPRLSCSGLGGGAMQAPGLKPAQSRRPPLTFHPRQKAAVRLSSMISKLASDPRPRVRPAGDASGLPGWVDFRSR